MRRTLWCRLPVVRSASFRAGSMRKINVLVLPVAIVPPKCAVCTSAMLFRTLSSGFVQGR